MSLLQESAINLVQKMNQREHRVVHSSQHGLSACRPISTSVKAKITNSVDGARARK